MSTHRQCYRCKSFSGADKKYMVCSGCRTMTYCSVDCQRADWADHRLICATISKPGRVSDISTILNGLPLKELIELQVGLDPSQILTLPYKSDMLALVAEKRRQGSDESLQIAIGPRSHFSPDVDNVVVDPRYFVELVIWSGDPTKKKAVAAYSIIPVNEDDSITKNFVADSEELRHFVGTEIKPFTKKQDELNRIMREGGLISCVGAKDGLNYKVQVKRETN